MRKKLQQLHNEAAQKRFTTFIALLVVLLFAIGGSLQVQAQDANTNGTHIAGIESLTGCREDQVRAAAISDNTFPEEDKTKIFFLYNVQTGLLLNAGGYWGTHVSLKEYGMPLWIHIDKDKWIHLGQKFDSKESKEEGNYLEYETGNDSIEDNGVYIDRAYIYKGLTGTLKNIVKRGWKLEAVSGKTNTYRLYTHSNTSWSTNTFPSFGNTVYYLIAAKTQGDVDRNCYVVEKGNNEIADSNDEWRFLSYQQILDLQDKNTGNIISSIDLTFRLQCPSFSRENAAMRNWKAYQYGGSGKIRLGLEHYYKHYVKKSNGTTAGSNIEISDSYTNDFNNNFSYTFPDGSDAITFKGNKGNENYERHCGKYYCADAKNFRGTIYQDVKVSHGGTYVIECKGFSTTTKAKLYACLVNDNKPDKKTMHATILGQTNYMSEQEKKALHIEEQNMDYAAKEFYGSHKYFNSVLVQVPEPEGDVTRTIRFGIEIGTQGDTEPVEGEWTVFDDFRLLYTSRTIDGDLVLDQDRDNLEYLKCSNTYKSVTLHLNKTFDKDKWNGFVLPVSLTKEQLTQAFGPNVKLAKLDKLTSNEIQFVSINMSTVGDNEIAMKAYVPYIIFPTKHAEQTPAYTAKLSKIGNGEAEKVSVIIGKNHIDIPNVTFAVDEGNKNDLSKMNTTNWTTNSSFDVDGPGTSFVTGNGMTAFGTFARTFGTGTQNTDEKDDNYGKWTITDKSTIIEGRSDLKGCYFFSNGKMYSSATRARGLRGFSVWFAPKSASDGKSANVFLDGVSLDKTTGINPIIYGEEESRIDRFAHGIYSLNGQLISNSSSLDGLPSGIYILNGKKVIKR